jgi:predicted DNA-binding protein with PD1-like motif
VEITELSDLKWYKLRLGPGADLFQSLRDFLREKKLVRAFLVSSIGSLEKVICNYPATSTRMPPEVRSRTIEKFLEINGISGEIWLENGEVRVHLHGSVTHEAETLYGGGLADGASVLVQTEMLLAGIQDSR